MDMTVLEAAPEVAVELEPLTHFACCEAVPGTVEPALCGVEERVEPVCVDHVGCVVCEDLHQANFCPRHQTCPLTRPWNCPR